MAVEALLIACIGISLCAAQANVASPNHIIEGFEEASTQYFTVAGYRGCSLALTNRYFVVSGKQSALFTVTSDSFDVHHPPCFLFSPSIQDWHQYSTLIIHLVALPRFAVQGTGITVGLQRKQPSAGQSAYSFNFAVPPNTPVVVKIPLKQIKFLSSVQTVILGALSSSGIYLFDAIELSKDAISAVTVDTLESAGLLLPDFETVSLKQDSSYFFNGSLYCNPALPLDIGLVVHSTSGHLGSESLLAADGSHVLLEQQIRPTVGDHDLAYRIDISGHDLLNVTLQGHQCRIGLRDRIETARQNVNYVNQVILKKLGRKTISGFAGMLYLKDGSPDVSGMIKRLKSLGVNSYTYLIYYHSEKEFDSLPSFCAVAQAAGIEVWVMLVPPSTARSLPVNQKQGAYPPFGLDYVRWAQELARVSLKCPNLTLLMIDDFQYDLGSFTVNYTTSVYKAMKAINPSFMFCVTIYHDYEHTFATSGYLPYVDAVLFGFQANHFLVPDFGANALSLSAEINDYQKDFPGRLVIPCIYFTPHSSWPAGLPTTDYLKEAMSVSYNQAGVVWIYTVPSEGETVYDLAKKFIEARRVGKWQPNK